MALYTVTNTAPGMRGSAGLLLEAGETRSEVELTDEQVKEIERFGLLTLEAEAKPKPTK